MTEHPVGLHDATCTSATAVKAALLSYGLMLSDGFLARYGPPYLEKRRAYGNPDDARFLDRYLPQELFIMPDHLVTSVNVRAHSPWLLDWTPADAFIVRHLHTGQVVPVDFPRRPAFYDRRASAGWPINSIVNLYGGSSLGIFVYGNCSLVKWGMACQYCSIAPNRSAQTEFPLVIDDERFTEALEAALNDREAPVGQVMINGGNFDDTEKSFSYYANLVHTARRLIDACGRDVELHLIVFPPRDVGRFAELAGAGVGVAMNSEVFTPELFRRYCPGKEKLGGQAHLRAGLRAAVDVLGEGNVYSIIVGGLEPLEACAQGMKELAEMGVTPVINVFHNDPDTALANHPTPAADQIWAMGQALQQVYERSPYAKPFYRHCGRNSIDSEAYDRRFAHDRSDRPRSGGGLLAS